MVMPVSGEVHDFADQITIHSKTLTTLSMAIRCLFFWLTKIDDFFICKYGIYLKKKKKLTGHTSTTFTKRSNRCLSLYQFLL